jgi:S-adenosylmethionine-diacylgycerolhomoserine-N-methlytransferase
MAVSMSINSEADASPAFDHKSSMERMYRLQRHIYDVTRAYYLLGRDQLIARLSPPEGGSVLEIGCGTGRNLVQAKQRHPSSRFFGIDISDEMLKTACESVMNNGFEGSIRLAQADATNFDPRKSLGHGPFDRIYFSYTLSMIPDWQSALAHAAAQLAPNGELHIVDFGTCEGLPVVAKQALYRWLKAFHVTPRQTMRDVIARLAAEAGCTAETWSSHRGYAVHARLVRTIYAGGAT